MWRFDKFVWQCSANCFPFSNTAAPDDLNPAKALCTTTFVDHFISFDLLTLVCRYNLSNVRSHNQQCHNWCILLLITSKKGRYPWPEILNYWSLCLSGFFIWGDIFFPCLLFLLIRADLTCMLIVLHLKAAKIRDLSDKLSGELSLDVKERQGQNKK